MQCVFRKLSGAGHDEYEKEGPEEINAEFRKLMDLGYALFLNEVQIRSLEEAETLWEVNKPTTPTVYAVPALRGGRN